MEGDDILNQLQEENRNVNAQNTELKQAISSTSYQGQEDPNLIQYQIDTGEMLGKIEHFLRGEYMAVDQEGSEYWAKPSKTIALEGGKKGETTEVTNDDLILFNDYGVNSIMSIIGNYIDKNTILSFYDEMRINEILADLGDELANFIFCNYEKMGMNTNFKKTRMQLTVITILHSIESSYRRALRGEAMTKLNTSSIFTQSDSLGNRNPIQSSKNFNLFKPGTW